MNRRDWYERTDATWPAEVPPLTGDEAIRAARKLYRFVFGRTYLKPVTVTSGNRYSGYGDKGLVVNPVGHRRGPGGWKAMVHELSHAFGGGHSKRHARLEARMIREVLRRGWLDGSLKSEPKPESTQVDQYARKLGQIDGGIVRWERKKRRAENALRKLVRRRKYYLAKVA